MAAPTPTSTINWDGIRGHVRFRAAWTTADQYADQSVVDISTLSPAPNSVKIRSIDLIDNGDVSLTLEFDATTDQDIDNFAGQTDVSYQFLRDYTDGPNAGVVPSDVTAAGFTGDIVITSANAANLDEVNLYLVFERSS